MNKKIYLWKTIQEILEDIFLDYDINVVVANEPAIVIDKSRGKILVMIQEDIRLNELINLIKFIEKYLEVKL